MTNDDARRELLARAETGLASAHDYRRKVHAMITERERAVRRASLASGVGYAVALLVAVALMVAAGVWFEGQLRGVWLGVNACFWLIFASVLVFNRLVVRNHLEMLKELRGLEVRMLELQERLERR